MAGDVGPMAVACVRMALASLAIILAGCTSVGVHTRERYVHDYGPPMQLRVCVLHTDKVTPQRIESLIAGVNQEFAPYGIEVVVPWSRPWERAGFTYERLFDDVARRDLEPPCDRLLGFVDRNAADALWGLLMPEVLGMVDDATHTRGYVVATQVSLNQLFTPPSKTTVHEFYHLLGCPHAGALDECYTRIAALKNARAAGSDFVPGIGGDGRFLLTRDVANRVLREALAGP